MADHTKPLPAWALGLIIAVVIFGIGLLVFAALGFGDDPVLDPNAAELLTAWM